MEDLAEEIFAKIDAMGDGSMLEGVLTGIESGWFQQAIADSAFNEQRRFESGGLTKVGVMAFVDEREEIVDTLVIGPDVERRQVEALREVRSSRDERAAREALAALVAAAATDTNLVDPLVVCARTLCTEGEIVGALTREWGAYLETPRF
jgi:methylmalonyl-CoA mutase N-terminal domain/subunit